MAPAYVLNAPQLLLSAAAVKHTRNYLGHESIHSQTRLNLPAARSRAGRLPHRVKLASLPSTPSRNPVHPSSELASVRPPDEQYPKEVIFSFAQTSDETLGGTSYETSGEKSDKASGETSYETSNETSDETLDEPSDEQQLLPLQKQKPERHAGQRKPMKAKEKVRVGEKNEVKQND
jgi:hypothetical protein